MMMTIDDAMTRISTELRRTVADLNARIERLEQEVRAAQGQPVDWTTIEERRVDLDIGIDAALDQVRGLLEGAEAP